VQDSGFDDAQSWSEEYRMSKALRRLLRRRRSLVPRSRTLYRLCKRYVDDYNGDNNCDMYANGELHFARSILREKVDAVAFDVGANRGEWSAAILEINPSIQVHCFEPCGSAFRKLMARDLPGKVVRNNFGLSSRPGVQKMFIFGNAHTKNSLHPRLDRESKAHEEVRLETLVDYCVQHDISAVHYLKVDVEGHELDVLLGAKEMLAEQRIHIVQFEYGEAYVAAGVLLKDVVEFMADFDYDLYKLMPRGLILIGGYDTKLENFLNSNYVLVLRGGLEASTGDRNLPLHRSVFHAGNWLLRN
jgi:FkbM family methyltransferase